MSKLTLLSNALDEHELSILQEALQNLYAKRVKAWRTSSQISYFNGHAAPERSEFKIDEVENLLAELNIEPLVDASESNAGSSYR